MQASRDINIITHILGYCEEIDHTINTFGREYGIFRENTIYQNAVAMCVLQIGELTTHFTEDFKSKYNKIPWNQVKALRNVVAHNYGKVDREILWDTLIYDIPKLVAYCNEILEENL